MNNRSLTADTTGAQASVLDHASEFVDLVHAQAPGEYRRLLASARFREELAKASVFNHGKLYVYAEYSVFRMEFLRRFPDSNPAACTNAFCSLFLKNDISITNLVDFIERPDDHGALLANRSRE